MYTIFLNLFERKCNIYIPYDQYHNYYGILITLLHVLLKKLQYMYTKLKYIL